MKTSRCVNACMVLPAKNDAHGVQCGPIITEQKCVCVCVCMAVCDCVSDGECGCVCRYVCFGMG